MSLQHSGGLPVGYRKKGADSQSGYKVLGPMLRGGFGVCGGNL